MRLVILATVLSALAITPGQARELFSMSEQGFKASIASVKKTYPTLKAANQSKYPKFIDSHPKGLATGHAELAGFGVTMVAHVGNEPKVRFDKILNANDRPLNSRPNRPNLLFFQKGRKGKTKEWRIIGMGFSMEFDPARRPWINIGGRRHYFHVHEAGYHRLADGGFRCATDKNLRKRAKDAGKTVDRRGRQNITRDDLSVRANTIRHGRIWTLHVWFGSNNSPSFAMKDPWGRQSDKAHEVPSCAFFEPS